MFFWGPYYQTKHMHRPAHRCTHAGAAPPRDPADVARRRVHNRRAVAARGGGGKGTKRPRESDGASDPERVVRQNTTMVVSADDIKGLLRHEWGVDGDLHDVPPLRVRVMTDEEIRGEGERRSCILVQPEAAVALHPAVSVIGAKAFQSRKLKGTLELPPGLTKIGQAAFQFCTGFTGALTIPEGVVEIGAVAFDGCDFEGALKIPETVATIKPYTFYGCNKISSLDFGQSPALTGIGDYAFSGCTELKGPLTIPAGVTYIGRCAFGDCEGITSLDFGQTPALTYIGDQAFYNCSELKGPLTLPPNLTKIGMGAFQYVPLLTSVRIAIPRDRPLEIEDDALETLPA